MAKLKIEMATGVKWEAEGTEELISRERGAFMEVLSAPAITDRLAPVLKGAALDFPGCKIWRRTEDVVGLAALKRAITEGHGHEVLHPFDEVELALDNGRVITVVCAYVGQDFARFVLKDCYCYHKMNSRVTTEGGYFKSMARQYVLEGIYPHLPQEWKDVIRPRELVEVIDGEERRYTDPMWLPSVTDVFGSPNDRWWKDEPDSFQLPIFQRERDRVKEIMPDDPDYGGVDTWWCRTPYYYYTMCFCYVTTYGSVNHSAFRSRGLAPGFDL